MDSNANVDRVTAEAVRTALHLRTRYLIAERDMPSIMAAVAGMLDGEYERGYREGFMAADATKDRTAPAKNCSTCRSIVGCSAARCGGPEGFPCWKTREEK